MSVEAPPSVTLFTGGQDISGLTLLSAGSNVVVIPLVGASALVLYNAVIAGLEHPAPNR